MYLFYNFLEDYLPFILFRQLERGIYLYQRLVRWLQNFLSDNQRRIAYTLGIGGVLLVAPILGVLAAFLAPRETNPLLIAVALVAPLGVLVVQAVMNRFELAPVLILITAIFVPIQLPTGSESTIVDSLLVAMFFTANWIGKMIFVDKRLTFYPSPLNLPFYGIIAIATASLVWSNFFFDPLVNVKGNFLVVQIASTVVNLMLIMAAYLTFNFVTDIRYLQVMVVIMIFAAPLDFVKRASGSDTTLLNDGGMFTMCVFACGLSVFYFYSKLHWFWRILAIACCAPIQLYRFLVEVTWLAGWLGGFVVAAVLTFLRSQVIIVIGIVLIILLGLANAQTVAEAWEAESQESGGTRQYAAWNSWRITGNHWLLGTGQAAYQHYYTTYFRAEPWLSHLATHNTVLDVMAQNGIFSLFFLFWFIIVANLIMVRVWLRTRGRGDFHEVMAKIGLGTTLGSSIMMPAGDWMFPFAYTQTIAGYDYIVYSWLFMGMGVAIDRITREEARQKVEVEQAEQA